MQTPHTQSAEGPLAVEKSVVLVVDDEYGPRESIAFSLAGEFDVETAERGKDALACIRRKRYGVIVLDIRMPEMDGIRTLEELRKIDPHVAVIMLTGYGTLMTAQQAMAGGANEYLRKPPDIPELLQSVRKQAAATRERRAQAQASQDVHNLNAALKQEIQQNEPQIWQARASVELVHDLNNPLSVVIGYSSLVAEEARRLAHHDPVRSRKLLEFSAIVEKAADYCHQLSESWRLAAKRVTEYSVVDLVAIAKEVYEVIFFSNPTIHITGVPEAKIRGAKLELMRILQNLFKNSLEAGANHVDVNFARTENALVLTLSDNGTGMDTEQVKRAMRGGFSSKAAGTGLGLSICRHLAGAHGASFSIESKPGSGTLVRMVFPGLPPQ